MIRWLMTMTALWLWLHGTEWNKRTTLTQRSAFWHALKPRAVPGRHFDEPLPMSLARLTMADLTRAIAQSRKSHRQLRVEFDRGVG